MSKDKIELSDEEIEKVVGGILKVLPLYCPRCQTKTLYSIQSDTSINDYPRCSQCNGPKKMYSVLGALND